MVVHSEPKENSAVTTRPLDEIKPVSHMEKGWLQV